MQFQILGFVYIRFSHFSHFLEIENDAIEVGRRLILKQVRQAVVPRIQIFGFV